MNKENEFIDFIGKGLYFYLAGQIIIFIVKELYERIEKKNKLFNNGKLDNIIGLKSVKDEIMYYMDFIKNKNKYLEWSVNLPRGILLIGPPGTGKTLLVKTIAANLKIPVISACGSDFIEKFVGVGASRIRNLFAKAKRKKKCIVFIDEIDAIGGNRHDENNSERKSTLNQLLVELDGFNSSNNIILFAATNFVSKLDPALLRSGRFDKKVYFDPPNNEERAEMFKLYLKDITLPESLSFDSLAKRCATLTGADISNISNQAKIVAINRGEPEKNVTEEDLNIAIDEVMIGREKKERSLTKIELERVAHHEAGHALMGYVLKSSSAPLKVSIVPRGQAALGFSQSKPEDLKLFTDQKILSQISVLLGGRNAEKLIYKNLSTGASDDIQKVSALVYQYHNTWGMDEDTGPLNIESMGKLNTHLTRDIYNKCQELVSDVETFTFNTLKKYKHLVKKIANKLLEESTITYDTLTELLPENLESSLDCSF
jgi:ATP-dependent metalloprotease FtsH